MKRAITVAIIIVALAAIASYYFSENNGGSTVVATNSTSTATSTATTTPTAPPTTGSTRPQPAPKPSTPGTTTTAKPLILNIVPISAAVGTQITITGSNFSPTGNNVNLGPFRIASNLSSVNGNTLSFKLSQYAGPDCNVSPTTACPMWETSLTPNPYQLTVKNANGISNALTFTVVQGMTYY
jgi:hypothetical protein